MNAVYKSVWNESLGAWVAASELSAARGKRASTKSRLLSRIPLTVAAGAAFGLVSASAMALPVGAYNVALFNDEADGECTSIMDGSNTHGTADVTLAGCSAALGTGASATAVGLTGGGAGTNGTNFISNQNGAFVNGGLEVFGATNVAGAPVAYIHGSMSLFSDGTTSGTANKLIGVAAGTDQTDAVNVTQLRNVTSLLGSTAAVNNDGTVTAPSYKIGATTYNDVGSALGALSAQSAQSGQSKYLSANDAAGSSAGATAIGIGSIAVGGNAVADSTGGYAAALAIGSDSVAGTKATAIGPAATASAVNSVSIGTLSVADRAGTVSVGSATNQRQVVNVAAGTQANDAVNVTQLQNVATLLGAGAKVNADGSMTAPAYTVAGATYNTVGGAIASVDTQLTNKVAYDTSSHTMVTLGGVGSATPVALTNVAAGAVSAASSDAVNGSQLNATNQNVSSLQNFTNNVNNGGGVTYFHANSTLADSSATGTNSVAIGGAASATANNSVALGSNSVADRANSVSVGAAGSERQITNVAAGTASTDAVNLGQLTTVAGNVATLSNYAVKYDMASDGTVNYQSITLGGQGASQPTLITNVAQGKLTTDSTDAVNGSQLFATNQNVTALQNFTNNVNNGGGITYFHTNSTLADSSATGANSVAIGGAANATANNAVALGSNSVADRANSVSVGAAGSERQITNVAAGTASTDAANVGQLNAVSGTVTSLSASAIKYDTNADGTPDYANATLGNGNTGTALHNVAAGTSSMDAVNLGQMNDALGTVTNLAQGAYNPLFSADGDRQTQVATSSGTLSVASGANAVASGANAIASGANSVSSGSNAVAIGSGATASASNSVALGANAVADRANSVSVGTTSAGGQRQVTNVEAGTQGTDAVNVNQMQQSVNTGVKSANGYTDALRSDMNSGLSLANNHINSVGAMSSAMAMMAGSAAAVADKDNRFAAGTGVYRNKAAIAVGFQKRFGTNMVLTLGGSTTGEETTGGAGFAFGF